MKDLLHFIFKGKAILFVLIALGMIACTKYIPVAEQDNGMEFVVKGKKWGLCRQMEARYDIIPAIYDTMYWHKELFGYIGELNGKKTFYRRDIYYKPDEPDKECPFLSYEKDNRSILKEKLKQNKSYWDREVDIVGAGTIYTIRAGKDSLYIYCDGMIYSTYAWGIGNGYTVESPELYGPFEDYYITHRGFLFKQDGLWGMKSSENEEILPANYKKLFEFRLRGVGNYSANQRLSWLYLAQTVSGEWKTFGKDGAEVKDGQSLLSPKWLDIPIRDFQYRWRQFNGWRMGDTNVSLRVGNKEIGVLEGEYYIGG